MQCKEVREFSQFCILVKKSKFYYENWRYAITYSILGNILLPINLRNIVEDLDKKDINLFINMTR